VVSGAIKVDFRRGTGRDERAGGSRAESVGRKAASTRQSCFTVGGTRCAASTTTTTPVRIFAAFLKMIVVPTSSNCIFLGFERHTVGRQISNTMSVRGSVSPSFLPTNTSPILLAWSEALRQTRMYNEVGY